MTKKRDEPIAEIVPPASASRIASGIGSMKGTAKIAGDIVSPAVRADEWNAVREWR